MSFQFNKNRLARAIDVADFIIEDNGHSVAEAAKEFGCSIHTIRRDINFLGSFAFYSTELDALFYDIDKTQLKLLKIKYLKVQKTLKKITKEHCSNNINAKNAT